MKSICVFAGSSRGISAEYGEAAKALGAEIARRKYRLVYGKCSFCFCLERERERERERVRWCFMVTDNFVFVFSLGCRWWEHRSYGGVRASGFR